MAQFSKICGIGVDMQQSELSCRCKAHSNDGRASQSTALCQMVQCFPYGADTLEAHVRIQHCLLQQHPGPRNKVVIQASHYSV